MRRRMIGSLWMVFVLGVFAWAQDPGPPDVKDSVGKVLRDQQEAWNRHDLVGFMKSYWNSPELTFFSGAQRFTGWQSAMNRYVQNYASGNKEMGTLEFSNLQIEPLSEDSAFVRGAWHLTMRDGKTPHGLFTLIFRRLPDGWKIVHDHTAAE